MTMPSDLVALPTSPWDVRPADLPLDIEECRTAVWRCRGNITKAAELLKISSQRLRNFVNSSPRLSAELLEANEQLVDRAKDVAYEALFDDADSGRKDSMARFVLGSLGKGQGFGQGNGPSIKVNSSGPIQITWADGSAFTPGDDAKVINDDE